MSDVKRTVTDPAPIEERTARRPKRTFKAKAKILVLGAVAPSGLPYVHVYACGKKAWVPFTAFMGSGMDAARLLASKNIILLKRDFSILVEKVEDLAQFPPRPLIEKPGWSGRFFALPNGKVFGPRGTIGDPPTVLFAPVLGKCRARGTLEEWLEHVAMPLIGQRLATFVVMAMFASPLLRFTDRASNFGFELAGPKGVGKSTIQFVASSVMGPALSSSGSNYWITANATVAGLEGMMSQHSGIPMVIEEANLFAAGENSKARASKFNELVFRLSDGTVKARHQDHAQKRSRFIYITSTNEPLEKILAGERIAVSEAAADRLLTLVIGPDRPFGLFDFVPEGFDDASSLAASLNRAVARFHGQSIRHFLTGLVAAHAEGPLALRKRITDLVARFRGKVAVDPNSGSATRVADAFGLVYAAGILAIEWGALPKRMACLKAARAAYELNRSLLDQLTPKQRVLELARHKDAVRWQDGQLPDLTEEEIDEVPSFVRLRAKGRRELIMTAEGMANAFADPKAIFADPDVRAMMLHDGNRNTVKRRLSIVSRQRRVYCFRLPLVRS